MKKLLGIILTAAFLVQMVILPVHAAKKISADFDMMLAVLQEIDVIPESDEAFDKGFKSQIQRICGQNAQIHTSVFHAVF